MRCFSSVSSHLLLLICPLLAPSKYLHLSLILILSRGTWSVLQALAPYVTPVVGDSFDMKVCCIQYCLAFLLFCLWGFTKEPEDKKKKQSPHLSKNTHTHTQVHWQWLCNTVCLHRISGDGARGKCQEVALATSLTFLHKRACTHATEKGDSRNYISCCQATLATSNAASL